jgi:formylglycine-generating enzyme required for sulfatase activity
MDQVIHRVLWFDRFALDLTRGCLRAADRDVHLRPKTFEVLRHLAENAGRLVSKQELTEAVWPDVAVTDDSLVQCIRELRETLGDDAHRLVRTVSRRGYLLDAEVSTEPASLSSATMQSDGLSTGSRSAEGIRQITGVRHLRVWSAVGVGSAALSGLFFALGQLPAMQTNHGRAGTAANMSATQQTHRAFKDCDVCPDMVALSAGEFRMGSPESEFRRAQHEGLPRRVAISKPVAIGRFEITVDQFAAFVAETGAATGNQCRVLSGIDRDPPPWVVSAGASFRRPGFEVTGSHPAGCVSWHDAQAYVAWLRRRTGRPYRLPTEAEWEYAARAGTTTGYSFGEDATQLCGYAKLADLSTDFSWRGSCRAQATLYGSLPVGTLKPNPWGLFDMHGNVWEWVEDCWTADASEIPIDGSAFMRPDKCELGVIRGGSWLSGSVRLRSAFRLWAPTAVPYQQYGFRVALSVNERSLSALPP